MISSEIFIIYMISTTIAVITLSIILIRNIERINEVDKKHLEIEKSIIESIFGNDK